MEYKIIFSSDARKDLKELQKKAPQALPKLARRITSEHRLVYKIYDDVVEVLVLSAFGHYK